MGWDVVFSPSEIDWILKIGCYIAYLIRARWLNEQGWKVITFWKKIKGKHNFSLKNCANMNCSQLDQKRHSTQGHFHDDFNLPLPLIWLWHTKLPRLCCRQISTLSHFLCIKTELGFQSVTPPSTILSVHYQDISMTGTFSWLWKFHLQVSNLSQGFMSVTWLPPFAGRQA